MRIFPHKHRVCAMPFPWHNKLEPRFYCESGVERRIHEIFVGDYN